MPAQYLTIRPVTDGQAGGVGGAQCDRFRHHRPDHRNVEGVGDQAEVGATLSVRAWVALGSLSADDVEVQVVHGRIGSDDVLTGTTVTPMSVGESYDGNRHRFDAAVPLATSGPFGYTVRVVPRNDALASVAELGLVAEPA